jgi:uncharacterized membrane protein HdeD (DUF308 family)
MVVLARNWWLLALRGLVAVIFGVMTLFNPAASLAVLVLFFGAYAMVDGIFAIIAGATAPSGSRRWGWLIAGGVLGILVGIATLFMPQVTAFVLTVWIAVWAIFVGIAQIASAIRLRKEIEGEFWLILGGAVAVLFGIWALISPLAGAFAITFGIGFFAIVYGVTMLAVAFRLRGLHGRAAA